MFNVEGSSSAPYALKLARGIGLKSEINSTLFLNGYRVALLRHCVLMRRRAMPRKSGRLGGVAGSVVEYVIRYIFDNKETCYLYIGI